MKEFKGVAKHHKTSFSVIIPFRNEAKNLPILLQSIAELNYPKELVEFILVDDASTDGSVEMIQQFVISNEERGEISKSKQVLDTISKKNEITRTDIRIIKNIRTSKSPKKDAITTAISEAKSNWIVTSDADCILPENWLKSLDSFIQNNNAKMVVAPVNYKAENNFLEHFQLLDFMSMQGTTIGGFGMDFPFLCNGANFAYKKDAFLQLNGFEGNNNIASGDDVFLFEKFIIADKKSVFYLKSEEAIVTTFPVKTWSDLVNQRTRWAAKTGNFSSLKVKLIGLLVLLTNFMVVYYLLFGSLEMLFIPFVLKVIIDLFLFLPTIQFFKQEKHFYKWYLFAGFLYPFFSLLVILKSLFFKYNWKGRRFKK
ncbi:glycosyltransferase family 2 protein [Polaribacter sejongensis]|uniref:glycosyltransferase family 2 protein n=1 Tax=Polaribacter sejongensis TaxID=985043 RepID=UPI0021C28DE1|nr:glycosyltransferase [Polaribacter undariae]UWD30432.1 glycosyltransferase [Polaribacter undariae]